MGLFKPKQLGKKVTCMRCGRHYYLTKSADTGEEIAGAKIQRIPAKIPGYSMTMIGICTKCGNAACIDGNCYNRGCTCGNIRFDQEIAFYK